MILRHVIEPTDNTRLARLSGAFDGHLRAIEAALAVHISRRGAAFRVDGERGAARRALALPQSLYPLAARAISAEALQLALVEALGANPDVPAESGSEECLPAGAEATLLHTTSTNVVRHPLVARIVEAYDAAPAGQARAA